MRRNSMKEENKILGLMLRKKAGLAPEDIAQLQKWESFFNKEVHGATLTQAFEHGPALQGEGGISVAPIPNKDSIGMFMNRFTEVAWMLHRTLPMLQLSSQRFDSEWMGKWKLLDQNFHEMVKGTAELEREFFYTIIRFVNTKFPFNEETCYDTHRK